MSQHGQVVTSRDTPGDTLDYAELYREHWRPLIRVAQSLVDDVATAEDIVQDAFAALYRRERTLDDRDGAAGYLRVSVLNGARSALRRRRTFRTRSAVLYDDRPAPAADEATLLTAEHDAVRTALGSLPRRQREVLALRLLGELGDVEIAELTGMSHTHVRSAASRGLATLRASLADASPEGQS